MQIEETPIEFLKNLQRLINLSISGFSAHVLLIDEYIKMAERNPECYKNHLDYIDDKLLCRKTLMNQIEDDRRKVCLLDQEIEREQQAPYTAPMIFRIITLFGEI